MIVFCLCRNGFSKRDDSEYTWIDGKDVSFGYKKAKIPGCCVFKKSDKRCFFSSAPLVVEKKGSYTELTEKPEGIPLKELLPSIQNNIVGLEFNFTKEGFKLYVNSARISRARMFFLVSLDAIYFSPDLRLLLPYSEKKLRSEVAYGIIKYGDGPEYLTIVQDIFSIPGSTCLELDSLSFMTISDRGWIPLEDFKHYFKLSFPLDGGNVDDTTNILEKQAQYFSTKELGVLVSGGIDSTLLSFMYNLYYNKPYPAFFVGFGGKDSEIKFAQHAVKNTKAELHIFEMSEEDFISSFEIAGNRAIQPIGQHSTISGAFLCGNIESVIGDTALLDGQSADGVYALYGKPVDNLFKNPSNPVFMEGILKMVADNRLFESIIAFMELHGLRGGNRLGLMMWPTDSLMKDRYVRCLLRIGPYGNAWFSDAMTYTIELEKYYKWQHNLIQKNDDNDWTKYSTTMLAHISAKQDMAKTYDMRFPESYTIYPFVWTDVLKDQGHYTWGQKTNSGCIKPMLKKILEDYIDKDFIYRKKVGLNSQFDDWIYAPDIINHLIGFIQRPGGISELLIGKRKVVKLIKHFNNEQLNISLKHMIIAFAMQQKWCEVNKITI